MMRTSNPALNPKTFTDSWVGVGADRMTVQGTVNKTGLLLMIIVASAGFTWSQFFASGGISGSVVPWMVLGGVGGFITAMVTIFKKTWAPISAPIYALFQGLLLGGLSAMLEASYKGIAIQAVGLTFGTAFSLLLAYKAGLIQVTEKFRTGLMAATGGIALVYFSSFILGFFGISIPFIHSSGLFGIGFSLFVVVIAALNLVLDFDFIEKGEEMGAPQYMEWYAAFGLMVTLIWLYVEILRLLSKLRDNRR
jgi:uncharacterized YccA/Bax inhibitor family protein